MSEDGAAGQDVQLGGPSPKKQRPGSEVGSRSSAQKWKVDALAAASKAPTFGKTTFAAAAAASGDVPGWLAKKPEATNTSTSASANSAPSFFTSATKKVGTSSWLSGLSSATTTLGTVGSGVGATTKPPPAWMKSSTLSSATTTSLLGPKTATQATTAPPSWLGSSATSASSSASSLPATSSSLTSSPGLFSAASKGGAASWLKPAGSTALDSTATLKETGAAAVTATQDQGKREADSADPDETLESSPGKRRKYEEVGVRTGEESESCLQKVERVRLYHFRDGNWSERARECTLHLNETKGNGGSSEYRARIVIRTKETKSLVFNASLWPTMDCQKHGASEKVTRICCYNVAETDGGAARIGTYLISPSDKNDGARLRAGIETAKLKCPTPKAGAVPASSAKVGSSTDGQEDDGGGGGGGSKSEMRGGTGTSTGTSTDAGTHTGTDINTRVELPTHNAMLPAAVGSGGMDPNAKASEAPLKKLKTAGDEELAQTAVAAAATTGTTDDIAAATDASPVCTDTKKGPVHQPPQQQEQQQKEEEEDPDADL